MVTSTSMPGSMDIWVICRTFSVEETRSITRLWIRIWKRSQVLEPSPLGVFLVVIRRVLVGCRIGPLTLSPLSLPDRTISFEMRSIALQFFEEMVIRILWLGSSSCWISSFLGSYDIFSVSPDRLYAAAKEVSQTLV